MTKQKIRANIEAMLAEQTDTQIYEGASLLASGHRHGELPALDLYGDEDKENRTFCVQDIALTGNKISLCELCGDYSATLMAHLSADLDAAAEKEHQAEKYNRELDAGQRRAEDRKHFPQDFNNQH